MFKRIAAYFAGAPAPVREIKTTALPQDVAWQPSEPVLSILQAVKTRRKTILLAEHYKYGRYCSTNQYGFADTVTGRCTTIRKRRYAHGEKYEYVPEYLFGLTSREITWLIDQIKLRMAQVEARAAALAGAKARRELMQEYVK